MKPGEFFVLEKVLFVRSIVVAQPGFNPSKSGDDSELQPLNTIDVQRDEQVPNRFFASMRTVLNESKSDEHPYHIDMECVCALDQVDETLGPDDALRGATITAHSVLYGAIRESVSWITGRQPWGSINLGLSVLRNKPSDQGVAAAREKAGPAVDAKNP